MSETSFIADARQALREADQQLGKGHIAPLHEQRLKARLAELIIHAAGLEDSIRESWGTPRRQDDSEHRKIRVEGEIEVCAGCVNSLGYNVAWDQAHAQPAVEQIAAFLEAEEAKTPMVDLHRKGVLDGIRATLRHMQALNAPKVPRDEPADLIDKILAVLDAADGLCYCQSYAGEKHDDNPPCQRMRLARNLAAIFTPEVPRG